MVPELGHFSLILALCLAITLGVVPMIGAFRGDARLLSAARPLAHGQFVFVVFAFAFFEQVGEDAGITDGDGFCHIGDRKRHGQTITLALDTAGRDQPADAKGTV